MGGEAFRRKKRKSLADRKSAPFHLRGTLRLAEMGGIRWNFSPKSKWFGIDQKRFRLVCRAEKKDQASRSGDDRAILADGTTTFTPANQFFLSLQLISWSLLLGATVPNGKALRTPQKSPQNTGRAATGLRPPKEAARPLVGPPPHTSLFCFF